MDELPRRIETLASMAQETRSISFGVEVEEEGPKHNRKTTMEDIKTVLQLNYRDDRVSRVRWLYIQWNTVRYT